MFLDIATEELSHLEMTGQLCVQLLRGSPSATMDEVEGSYLGDLGLPPERVLGALLFAIHDSIMRFTTHRKIRCYPGIFPQFRAV
jgi:Mn-containing catalase